MENKHIFYIFLGIFLYAVCFQDRYEFVVKRTFRSDGTIKEESVFSCDKKTGECRPPGSRWR